MLDLKGEELGWAMYDPHGPLSLRMVSLEKKPPNAAFFEQQVKRAVALRQGLNLEGTTAYRLINGEGDFLPGLVCDVYGSTSLTTGGDLVRIELAEPAWAVTPGQAGVLYDSKEGFILAGGKIRLAVS